jgi:hypothetical protein
VTMTQSQIGALQCELGLLGGIQARFEEFHRLNPNIYRALVRLARYHVRHGVKRFSIDYLYHALRWQETHRTQGREYHKFNDHFTSRYARLIEEQELDLRGCFTTRKLRAD